MLIPSIDLMDGKIVQLVQGGKKALEFENFDHWIERFSEFSLVQLIDLDAAMGKGSNRHLITNFCAKLPCQVGGGIRSADDVQALLACGARKVILGSSLIQSHTSQQSTASSQVNTRFAHDTVNVDFASSLFRRFGAEPLVFAVDARNGLVAIRGWKTLTDIEPAAMMRELEPFCSAFLYTHIDTEGLMQGIPIEIIRDLRLNTSHRLIAAGGICTTEEIEELDRLGVDAVVGMAIYSGVLGISTS